MKRHVCRSAIFTLLGIILSGIIFIIVLPFVLVRKISDYYKQNKESLNTLGRKINEQTFRS